MLASLCRRYTIDPVRAFEIHYGHPPAAAERRRIIQEADLGMSALATRDHNAKDMPAGLRSLSAELNTRLYTWQKAADRGFDALIQREPEPAPEPETEVGG